MLLPPKQAEAEHRSARSTRNAVQHDDGSDNDDIDGSGKDEEKGVSDDDTAENENLRSKKNNKTDGDQKDNEGDGGCGGDDDDDKDSDDDDLSKKRARKAKGGTKAQVYCEESIAPFIRKMNYDRNPKIVRALHNLHRTLFSINAESHKFLIPYSRSHVEVKLYEKFKGQCNKSGGTFMFVEGPFLVAISARLRASIFDKRDLSEIFTIETDSLRLFLGQEEYHRTRLLATTQKLQSIKVKLNQLSIRSNISKKTFIASSEEDKSSGAAPEDVAPGSTHSAGSNTEMAKIRKEVMEKAGLVPLGFPPEGEGKKQKANSNEMDSILAPKCASPLLAHVLTTGIVVSGLEAIRISELSSDTKTDIITLASTMKYAIEETTTISDVCSKVVLPALQKKASRKASIVTFMAIVSDVKSKGDTFSAPAAKSLVENNEADAADATDDTDDGLSGEKIQQYLTVFSGIILCDCFRLRCKELFQLDIDALELFVRCAPFVLRNNLAPMIMQGGECIVFDENLSDDKIVKMCCYLENLLTGAQSSNFGNKDISKKRWKSVEYWKKWSMLENLPDNADLFSRALMIDDEKRKEDR